MPTTNRPDEAPSPPPPPGRRKLPDTLRRITVEGVCVPFPVDEAAGLNQALASFPKPRRSRGESKSA